MPAMLPRIALNQPLTNDSNYNYAYTVKNRIGDLTLQNCCV